MKSKIDIEQKVTANLLEVTGNPQRFQPVGTAVRIKKDEPCKIYNDSAFQCRTSAVHDLTVAH